MFLSSSVYPDGTGMEHVNRGQPTERVINHIQSQCDNTEGGFTRELNFLKILSNSSFKRRLTWDLSCEHQSRKEEWSWILRGKSTIGKLWDRWSCGRTLEKVEENKIKLSPRVFGYIFQLPHLHLLLSVTCWQHSEDKFFFVTSGLHSGGLEGWREDFQCFLRDLHLPCETSRWWVPFDVSLKLFVNIQISWSIQVLLGTVGVLMAPR